MFVFFISFVVFVRVAELLYSKKNEKWLLEQNAVEYGGSHYPFIVTLHILFFLSLITEYFTRQTEQYNVGLLILYCLLVAVKIWIITSLGKFWNTKIYRVPDVPLISKGPYKYLKHPNYLVVIGEIVVIPLAFHLYYTAIIFSLLNIIMLYVRIKEENKALQI